MYDGTEQQTNSPEVEQSTTTKSASSNQPAEPTTSEVNLDESDDLEIVFESTKPKSSENGQSNNQNTNRNHNHKSQTASHSNQKQRSRQASKENDDPSSNIVTEYWFEIPQPLCGLLIGTKGSFINNAMRQSNTLIALKNHPTILNMNLCMIKGRANEIQEALSIIRQRFPLKKFPQLTLNPTNPDLATVEPIPQSANSSLVIGINVDVVLSEIISPGHFFLQQPTHPTFSILPDLDKYLIATYQNETPRVDNPQIGIICKLCIHL